MTENTSLDPERMRRAANKIEGVANEMSGALRALNECLDQHQGAWGNDQFGKNFAKSYLPAAKKCLESSGSAATNIGDFGKGLGKAAGKLQQQDEQNAEDVKHLF